MSKTCYEAVANGIFPGERHDNRDGAGGCLRRSRGNTGDGHDQVDASLDKFFRERRQPRCNPSCEPPFDPQVLSFHEAAAAEFWDGELTGADECLVVARRKDADDICFSGRLRGSRTDLRGNEHQGE